MNLNIADFIIRLSADRPFQLEEGYLPFIDQQESSVPDVTIECISDMPVNLLNGCTLLFEASNEHQPFYSIFRHEEGLAFRIYNQQTKDVTQQIALLNNTFDHWRIYSANESGTAFFPLKYPMGPIMMYYLTVKNQAIMMHASGVFDGKKGRLFTGFSGTGKSTISNLWKESGSQLINDDRLIVRKRGDHFFMFNTPMFYQDLPKEAPLHAIHLIRHACENDTKKISGARAVSNVLAFCIQHNFNKQFMANHLNFIHELCQEVGVFKTGFVPDAHIVQFIKEHES